MAGTITLKTKGKAKEKPKDTSSQELERERARPYRGRKLSHHNPSNVANIYANHEI